jgi:hypothetical protein
VRQTRRIEQDQIKLAQGKEHGKEQG